MLHEEAIRALEEGAAQTRALDAEKDTTAELELNGKLLGVAQLLRGELVGGIWRWEADAGVAERFATALLGAIRAVSSARDQHPEVGPALLGVMQRWMVTRKRRPDAVPVDWAASLLEPGSWRAEVAAAAMYWTATDAYG